jgi:hypothetical protein
MAIETLKIGPIQKLKTIKRAMNSDYRHDTKIQSTFT